MFLWRRQTQHANILAPDLLFGVAIHVDDIVGVIGVDFAYLATKVARLAFRDRVYRIEYVVEDVALYGVTR